MSLPFASLGPSPVLTGPGLHVSKVGSTTVISLPRQRRQKIAPANFPFKILSAGQNLGVSPESTLFKSLAGDNITITGLLSDETDMSDPGWFACPNIGEKIWLKIGTSAAGGDAPRPLVLTASTTNLQKGAAGGSLWDEYPDPISVNKDDATKPFQEFYNLLLAEITDPETDTRPAIATVTIGTGDSAEKRQITQMWSRNISMWMRVVNGLLCYIPADPALDSMPTPL